MCTLLACDVGGCVHVLCAAHHSAAHHRTALIRQLSGQALAQVCCAQVVLCPVIALDDGTKEMTQPYLVHL